MPGCGRWWRARISRTKFGIAEPVAVHLQDAALRRFLGDQARRHLRRHLPALARLEPHPREPGCGGSRRAGGPPGPGQPRAGAGRPDALGDRDRRDDRGQERHREADLPLRRERRHALEPRTLRGRAREAGRGHGLVPARPCAHARSLSGRPRRGEEHAPYRFTPFICGAGYRRPAAAPAGIGVIGSAFTETPVSPGSTALSSTARNGRGAGVPELSLS